MATKREELDTHGSCLDRAAEDEPLFILRAQDRLAPHLVRIWAHAAAVCGAPDAKVAGALETADRMEEWGGAKKVPD